MDKIIGNAVTIFLKGSDNILGDMSGILVDVSVDSLYIQDASSRSKTFVIPRENVSYSTTDGVISQRTILGEIDKQQQYHEVRREPQHQEPIPSPRSPTIDKLNVYVNELHVASIPIPPTFKVDAWNDNILRVLMGNPEVQNALAGKVQKGLEYYPGEVYIEAVGLTPPSQMPDNNPGSGYQTGFSMGGSPTEQYLSPLQMAARLNGAVKRGNDDDKTDM